MQTPAQIEFEHVTASPKLQAAIDGHIAELEKRYGRATAGRIIVRGPGDRHKTGGQYQVSIRLCLPEGREVNVGRTPKQDERYADLTFAVDDAFKRARRQLQDQVHVMHGQTKLHEGLPVGTVVRIDPSGEFGFLRGPTARRSISIVTALWRGARASLSARVSALLRISERRDHGPARSGF